MNAASSAKRLRLAARLLVPGLAIAATTLLWDHPLAFVAFAVIGGALAVVSIGLFLWAAIAHGPAEHKPS
jgi:uncharacterized membrane protein